MPLSATTVEFPGKLQYMPTPIEPLELGTGTSRYTGSCFISQFDVPSA